MRGVHSYGTEAQAWEGDGLRASETVLPAGLVLQPHAHPAAQVCFVLEGTYTEATDSGEHVLRPGVVQVHEPCETHANRFGDEGALALVVSYDARRWRRLPRGGPRPGQALLGSIAADIRCELERADEAAAVALEGLALLLLARVSRRSRVSEPPWLGDALALVERDYAAALSLAAVAARVGVHRATLAAAARRFRRTSVGEYIRDVRLRHATEALLGSRAPLAEIAVRTGFADQAHFTRVFRKRNGVAPGVFRRAWRP